MTPEDIAALRVLLAREDVAAGIYLAAARAERATHGIEGEVGAARRARRPDLRAAVDAAIGAVLDLITEEVSA